MFISSDPMRSPCNYQKDLGIFVVAARHYLDYARLWVNTGDPAHMPHEKSRLFAVQQTINAADATQLRYRHVNYMYETIPPWRDDFAPVVFFPAVHRFGQVFFPVLTRMGFTFPGPVRPVANTIVMPEVSLNEWDEMKWAVDAIQRLFGQKELLYPYSFFQITDKGTVEGSLKPMGRIKVKQDGDEWFVCLDGEPLKTTERGAAMVSMILEQRGRPISFPDMEKRNPGGPLDGGNTTDIRKEIPQPIRDLMENVTGWRFADDAFIYPDDREANAHEQSANGR